MRKKKSGHVSDHHVENSFSYGTAEPGDTNDGSQREEGMAMTHTRQGNYKKRKEK